MKLSELHDSEELFGYEFVTDAYKREPKKSRERICEYLVGRLAGVTEKQIFNAFYRNRPGLLTHLYIPEYVL